MRSFASLRMTKTPYLLTLPALLLFALVVIVPLVMTVLLSFHDWGQYKGIEPVFVLKNVSDFSTHGCRDVADVHLERVDQKKL